MKIHNIKLQKIAAVILAAAVLICGIYIPYTDAAAKETEKNTSLFSAPFDDADTLEKAGADITRDTTTLYTYTDADKTAVSDFDDKYGDKALKVTNSSSGVAQVQFKFPNGGKLTSGEQGVLSFDYYANAVSGGKAFEILLGAYYLLNLNYASGEIGYVTYNDTGAWKPVKITSFTNGWNHIDMMFTLTDTGRVIDFYIDGEYAVTYSSKFVGEIDSVKFAIGKTDKEAVYYIDNLTFTELGDFNSVISVVGAGGNGKGGASIEIAKPENTGNSELAAVTVGNTELKKKNNGEIVEISSVKVDDSKIVITPRLPLDYDEQYVLELKGFKDKWGRSFPIKEFNAESELDENGKPVLRVTNMLLEAYNGEMLEPKDAITPEIRKVYIYFNTDIKADTLADCIRISGKSDGFTYDYDADGKVLSVDLNSVLVENTNYTIDVVRENIQTIAGAQVQPYSRSFKTTAGAFRVGKLGWEKENGDAVDTLETGEIYLIAELINTTGNKEEAVLSYFNDGEFDFAKIEVVSGGCISKRLKADAEATAKEIGGMLYDAASKLNPLADAVYLAKNEPSEPEFTISGKATPGSKLILQVFKPELKNDKLIISNDAVYKNILVYQGEVAVGENGEWSKKIDVDNKVSGQYWYYITSESKDKAVENNYIYINSTENDTALEWLEGIADAPTAEQFKEYQADLGFYNELLNTSSEDAVMELLYEAKSEGLYSDLTTEKAINIFNKAVVRAELENKNISDVLEYSTEMGLDKTAMGQYLDDSFVGVNLKNLMNSRLDGKKFNSFEEFDAALDESFVIATVRYPDGYENARNVMRTYAGKIGVSEGAVTDAVSQAVIGNEYNGYSDLRQAINSVNKKPDKEHFGGGSSGGAGGGSIGNMKAELPVGDNKEPLEEIENTEQELPFNDISDAEWAREAIMSLYEKKIVNGKESGKFCPNDNIIRAEFIKMLVCALGLQEADSEINFSDVRPEDWYYSYIKTAAANGIAFGNDDGSFGTNDNITRQDMAVMVYRAIDAVPIEDSSYTLFTDDADIADYAKEAVYALRDKNIISGLETGEFAPLYNASRAEAATIIYNMIREAL